MLLWPLEMLKSFHLDGMMDFLMTFWGLSGDFLRTLWELSEDFLKTF
jgi:hypothetical protein